MGGGSRQVDDYHMQQRTGGQGMGAVMNGVDPDVSQIIMLQTYRWGIP